MASADGTACPREEDPNDAKPGEILACQRAISIRRRLRGEDAAAYADIAVNGILDLSRQGNVVKLLESLYRDHPPSVWRSICRREMERTESVDKKSLVYGEVGFLAIASIFRHYTPPAPVDEGHGAARQKCRFYDLGSGSGRAVFSAAFVGTCITHAVGIEILPELHALAHEVLGLFQTEVAPFLGSSRPPQEISFVQGDFLIADWSDGDIVFANSTCFSDGLLVQLEDKATRLRPGSLFVTVSKRFQNEDNWNLLECSERRMSWGPADIFVHRRK